MVEFFVDYKKLALRVARIKVCKRFSAILTGVVTNVATSLADAIEILVKDFHKGI